MLAHYSQSRGKKYWIDLGEAVTVQTNVSSLQGSTRKDGFFYVSYGKLGTAWPGASICIIASLNTALTRLVHLSV